MSPVYERVAEVIEAVHAAGYSVGLVNRDVDGGVTVYLEDLGKGDLASFEIDGDHTFLTLEDRRAGKATVTPVSDLADAVRTAAEWLRCGGR